MELELKKASLDAFETGGEFALTQEETAETIVPDYCPDIARIINTEGKIYIHGRELRDGKAEVSGTIRVTVLYTPDGEGGIRTLEFAIPFTVESDHRSLMGCTYLMAQTEAELLETRMLNPRKVFTRCKLVSRLSGYQREPLACCTDLDADPALCIEKRQEHQRVMLLTHICEKDFTFTDDMNISPGREGVAELLTTNVTSAVTESKLVGSKLIFKGSFCVSLLYRTIEGRCASTSAELPFSQIMEIDREAEGAIPCVQLQLSGTDFQISGDDPDGRQVTVTLYLHATAMLRQEQEVTLLSDLYSTAYETAYEAEPLNLTGFFETMTRRQTVREVLEIGVVAESILSIYTICGAVSIQREGQTTVLRSPVTIRALYLDEGGVPLVAERCVEVNCQLELPEDCRLTASAVCTEEVQGSIGERGIEVRFPVDFRIEAASRTKRVCISAARLDQESPKDLTGTPSLVLRCLGKQESPWDLAKKYNTTISAILAANLLEGEEELPREKLLLIPRKRT